MKRQRSPEITQVAREYVDRIIEINRRHGMGGRIPKETYDAAVEVAARASNVKGSAALVEQAE